MWFFISLWIICLPFEVPGEGNVNPLQYSGLENPMDKGALRVIVYRAAKSWTRLKWLRMDVHLWGPKPLSQNLLLSLADVRASAIVTGDSIFLGLSCVLEKEMATHSSSVAWKIPWTEKPGRLQSMGRKESDTTERLHFTPVYACMLSHRWLVSTPMGSRPPGSSVHGIFQARMLEWVAIFYSCVPHV